MTTNVIAMTWFLWRLPRGLELVEVESEVLERSLRDNGWC